MLHTALGIGVYKSISVSIIIFTYFVLLHRVYRDGKRCSERYGADWKRYCQKVPYCLVPYVY
jgi:protein-S-isoprenylcysteine O-methyltransferase Ste14